MIGGTGWVVVCFSFKLLCVLSRGGVNGFTPLMSSGLGVGRRYWFEIIILLSVGVGVLVSLIVACDLIRGVG